MRADVCWSPWLDRRSPLPYWGLIKGSKMCVTSQTKLRSVNSGVGMRVEIPSDASAPCQSFLSHLPRDGGAPRLEWVPFKFQKPDLSVCRTFYLPVIPAPLSVCVIFFVSMDLPQTHLPVIFNNSSCLSLAIVLAVLCLLYTRAWSLSAGPITW